MLTNDPRVQMRWSGQSPLEGAVERLNDFGCVEIEMPAEYHHAIYSHLYPGSWHNLEQVDESGGVELLERIAEVDQLSGLRQLVEALAGRTAHVVVRSPAPHVRVSL